MGMKYCDCVFNVHLVISKSPPLIFTSDANFTEESLNEVRNKIVRRFALIIVLEAI